MQRSTSVVLPWVAWSAPAQDFSGLQLQKRKELAHTDGHVLLLEYFEEHPPLLARPGETVSVHFDLLSCE